MNRTMISIVLVLGCLCADGVLAQGVQKHPHPSMATTTSGTEDVTGTAATGTALSSSVPEQSISQAGQDRLQNLLNKRKGLPPSAFKIRGTWTFSGDLLQTTCPAEVEQQRVSHIFTVEQNEDVLYVTSG